MSRVFEEYKKKITEELYWWPNEEKENFILLIESSILKPKILIKVRGQDKEGELTYEQPPLMESERKKRKRKEGSRKKQEERNE